MKRILTGALALSMLSGTAAFAAPPHQNDHGGYNQNRDNYQPSRNDDRNDNRDRNDNGNHYGQQKHWKRGQRLPVAYYQDRGHFVDYRASHLRAPPRGYRWVRTDDNNYAMVAIATGLIASLIAANN